MDREFASYYELENEKLESILWRERFYNKEFENRKKIMSDDEFNEKIRQQQEMQRKHRGRKTIRQTRVEMIAQENNESVSTPESEEEVREEEVAVKSSEEMLKEFLFYEQIEDAFEVKVEGKKKEEQEATQKHKGYGVSTFMGNY